MPVAMMTTSATRSAPAAKRRRLRPLTSSIFVSLAPVRTVTPCRLRASPRPAPAPVASTMRGRMRGAISTMVSLAPSERIELRIVNEMKPAPTITTWLPGVIAARTPRACSSVQNECTPLPVGARDRRAHRRGAGGDQAVVVLDGACRRRACTRWPSCRGAAARRPRCVLTPQPASTARGGRVHVRLGDRAVEVVRQHHPRVRPLGADQRDLRAARVSSSRMVRMAFMPAVPPPMIRCRRAISALLQREDVLGRARGRSRPASPRVGDVLVQ